MDKTDTPRTLANEYDPSFFYDYVKAHGEGPEGFCEMEFAATLERDLAAATKRVEELEADANRWKHARKYLSFEEIEYWSSDDWRGHEPNERESKRADDAIDAALSPKTEGK